MQFLNREADISEGRGKLSSVIQGAKVLVKKLRIGEFVVNNYVGQG